MRRANEERQRAEGSADPAVAQIHRELAEHYEGALASLHRIATTLVDGRLRAIRR
jgi:hypothetical protein